MPGTRQGKEKVLSTACAECKRLKLKCSKTLPCSACIRRGCEFICPDGQLKPGKGTRFILSDTQELHDEIDRLKFRVKELEETIAVLRGHQTSEVVETRQYPTTVHTKRTKVGDEEVSIDTFGSLTLKSDGSSEWYGRHGSAEYLMGPRHNPQSDTEELLPLGLMFQSKMFPLKTSTDIDNEIRKQVRGYLPPRAESWKIVEDYTSEYASRSGIPFTWEEIVDKFLEPAYNGTAKDEEVAFLFILLATGISNDHSKQPEDPVARRFAHLSRISLMLGEDLLCTKSLVVICYLHRLAMWYQISLDPAGASKAWMLTSMAIRMAQAAGLHRDSERWNSYPVEAERRRKLWWELSMFEYYQSISMARPRCIIRSQCDCKMPEDPEDRGGQPSFQRGRYRWYSECLLPIMDEVFSTKPPPYSTIIKYDHRLREYPMPNFAARERSPECPLKGAAFAVTIIQLFSTDAMRELTLLYIHRTYLVEALSRWPEDPLQSQFGLSVLAVHRSSLVILQGFNRIPEHLISAFPQILSLWLHCVSAYICLCAIVIRSPNCSLGRSSMVEIENARRNFDHAVLQTLQLKLDSVKRAKHIIDALYEQAVVAYKAFQSGQWPLETRGQDPNQIDVLRLAGASNIFTQRREDGTADSTSGSTRIFPAIPQDTIHPALLRYIQAVQGGDASIQGSCDSLDIDPSKTNAIFSERSPSGHGLDPLTSSRVPRGMPGATSNSVGAPPTQQVPPQVPADGQPWSTFESSQSPFTQEATYSLGSFSDFDSIFRFQSPFLHTQYPQFSDAGQTFQHTQSTGPSPASDDLSRGFGEMRVKDTRMGSGLNPAPPMAENVPGFAFDGMGINNWEACLAGWQP